mmetsp:Transcript_76888/g.205496  ORF Transcript_76888/g.205496 Transcript_76888/m.205496 type:complete len:148 (+) Transcript_76888:193-636(+)
MPVPVVTIVPMPVVLAAVPVAMVLAAVPVAVVLAAMPVAMVLAAMPVAMVLAAMPVAMICFVAMPMVAPRRMASRNRAAHKTAGVLCVRVELTTNFQLESGVSDPIPLRHSDHGVQHARTALGIGNLNVSCADNTLRPQTPDVHIVQ